MPKKLFKVPNFHGGLDETSSPVDLKDGFFTDLTDVMVDRMGQVVPMGDFDNAPTDDPTGTGFVVHSDPGYGLFAFASNRRLSGVLADCVIYVAQQFISGDFGEQFIFWDNAGNSWGVITALDLQDGTTENQFLPDYFVFDNVLRICDANFIGNINTDGTTDTKRGWLGYLENARFLGASNLLGEPTLTGWQTNTAPSPVAPTRGAVSSLISGTGTIAAASGTMTLANIEGRAGGSYATELEGHYIIADEDVRTDTAPIISDTGVANTVTADYDGSSTASGTYTIYPPPGTGVNLNITVATTGGFLPDIGDDAIDIDSATYTGYRIGSTFVYDGYQESNIYEMKIGWTTPMEPDIAGLIIEGDDTNAGKITGSIAVSAGYDSRITGCRIYCQHTDDLIDNWYLMWDVDFNQGARTSMSTDEFTSDSATVPFTHDIAHGFNDKYLTMTLPPYMVLNAALTYSSINGYGPKENLDIRYKTSTMVNGIVFVGNVFKSVDGKTQHFPDRFWYCAYPTFTGMPAVDVFPEANWNQNAAVSGDPIVKLIGFGNQLLAFGSSYLTVWTIQGAGNSVTGTYAGYGIDKPCQALRTPSGVAFANKSGVFLYNGENVTRLLEKKGSA